VSKLKKLTNVFAEVNKKQKNKSKLIFLEAENFVEEKGESQNFLNISNF
jgi:hypothetical protein